MTGDLITLPLRVSIAATSFMLQLAEEAAWRAVRTARQLTGAATPERPAPARPQPGVPPAAREATAPVQAEEPTHIPAEPAHVSEEPELAAETAEPGAEDGAGAEVHVTEPWDGYERMNATEIIARLDGAGPAELVAVRLYESGNRRRQTVLSAVERGLETATRSA